MYSLKKLLVKDFRNIELADLTFASRINCVCGDNGQGKTNLLDAIYFLSMTKSYASLPDQLCVRHGCQTFTLSGLYESSDGRSQNVTISFSNGEKILRTDGKRQARISANVGRFPVVMVSPGDSSLVSDSPDERRRFVNSVLCQTDPQYLAQLQQYNRLLMQRNRMLKEDCPDDTLLDVTDEQMEMKAEYVYAKRKELSIMLNEVTQKHYSYLSGGAEPVSLSYKPDVASGSFSEVWKAGRNRDRLLRYTVKGIHRDDFLFGMGDYPIRSCGSQGQQKSFLVALKFAQYDIMKEICGFPPILLLDDVCDKLDAARVTNLLKMVGDSPFGQIFISDTSRSRMEECVRELDGHTDFIIAENGHFSNSDLI